MPRFRLRMAVCTRQRERTAVQGRSQCRRYHDTLLRTSALPTQRPPQSHTRAPLHHVRPAGGRIFGAFAAILGVTAAAATTDVVPVAAEWSALGASFAVAAGLLWPIVGPLLEVQAFAGEANWLVGRGRVTLLNSPAI